MHSRPGRLQRRGSVHLHGQQLHVVPARDLGDAVGDERHDPRHVAAKGVQARLAQAIDRAFRDHEAALPVVPAVEHHEEASRGDATHRLDTVGLPARQPEPEHVHGSAELVDAKPGALPDQRGPAVGADHQAGADRQRTVRAGRAHAHDVAPLVDQVRHLGPHAERERRRVRGLPREEIEEMPLRHQRDEPASRRQVGEVRHRKGLVADRHRESLDLLVRKPEEAVQQPELVQHLQRRRVDRVAAEVAQEVGVLLEDDDLDTGAREEQAEHHAGRAPAGDAAGGRDLLVAGRAHDRLPRRPGNPSRLVAFRSSW